MARPRVAVDRLGSLVANRLEQERSLAGRVRVVELTALFGYDTMVSMTMLAHDMEVPADARQLKPRKRG